MALGTHILRFCLMICKRHWQKRYISFVEMAPSSSVLSHHGHNAGTCEKSLNGWQLYQSDVIRTHKHCRKSRDKISIYWAALRFSKRSLQQSWHTHNNGCTDDFVVGLLCGLGFLRGRGLLVWPLTDLHLWIPTLFRCSWTDLLSVHNVFIVLKWFCLDLLFCSHGHFNVCRQRICDALMILTHNRTN